MTHDSLASSRRLSGAFHDYVRGVFADQSDRARSLRANRARWLRRLGQASSGALQRWEGEGGSRN
jgi:hypothetical protein